MEKIILDFSNCKYISEIYKEIKNKFDFPPYYGENLDALWDCLDCYTPEPLKVSVCGIEKMSDDMRDYMNGVVTVFNDIHKQNPNIVFEYEKDWLN